MKQKYNIIKLQGRNYYQTEDKTNLAIIEDLEEQLTLDMENGIEVEILDMELHPTHVIETDRDVFEALFLNADNNSKENPIVLTPHLYQFIQLGNFFSTEDSVKEGHIVYKDGKKYFIAISVERGIKKGLSVTDENMVLIRKIVELARRKYEEDN